jgi:hypothetical protein
MLGQDSTARKIPKSVVKYARKVSAELVPTREIFTKKLSGQLSWPMGAGVFAVENQTNVF